ncbi:hypothetical protein D3C76_1674190 [compost metagenome]
MSDELLEAFLEELLVDVLDELLDDVFEEVLEPQPDTMSPRISTNEKTVIFFKIIPPIFVVHKTHNSHQ